MPAIKVTYDRDWRSVTPSTRFVFAAFDRRRLGGLPVRPDGLIDVVLLRVTRGAQAPVFAAARCASIA